MRSTARPRAAQGLRRASQAARPLPPLPSPFHAVLAHVLAEILVQEVRTGIIRTPANERREASADTRTR